jgi:hypothetical protein
VTDPVKPYKVISTLHRNEFNDQLGETVSGWLVKALWFATNTVLPVFVPEDVYTAGNVDKLIRTAGETNSAVHSL